MTGLTWIHLSDWHQRGKEYDRKAVRDALLDDIKRRKEINIDLTKIDFIIFGGDLAFTGKPEEYIAARDELLDPLLNSCGISPDRLFIVPGIHDMDRTTFQLLPKSLMHPLESTEEVQEWLLDEQKETRFLDRSMRSLILLPTIPVRIIRIMLALVYGKLVARVLRFWALILHGCLGAIDTLMALLMIRVF